MHHFGFNHYLSIEDFALEYFKKDNARILFTQNTADAFIGEFHYYLSDYSNQYLLTTAAHITDLNNIFVTNKNHKMCK